MIHYIIDGNNLIGKDSFLNKLQRKEKQSSREKLVLILDRYFINKKANVTLHFDGYPNETIRSNKARVIYSENRTADEKIKYQIEHLKSNKNTTVVTSDNNLAQFAKVCGCKVVASEEFLKIIRDSKSGDDEEKRIKEISNQEILKLFKSK